MSARSKEPSFTTRMHNYIATPLCAVALCFSVGVNADGLTEKKQLHNQQTLDTTVTNALDKFHTPGMAVGIVYNDEVVLAKGYGKANIKDEQAVNDRTLFRIASLSKAFTAAAMAILVDDEKVKWDSKVVDFLPEFTLYNPYVTSEFTIADLLTHRSGLVSGAGDSMIWPEPSGFSRQEVIHNLRYLSPEYGFRSRYAYSNVLYITAGELISKVSGMSFEAFLEERIFKPMKMRCFAGDIPENELSNIAIPYAYSDTKGNYPLPRNQIAQTGIMSAAAGGIVCDVNSMLIWAKSLLNRENLPFSERQLNTMWSAQTILPLSSLDKNWDKSVFKNYGMGWRIRNIGEVLSISHTGTLSGYQGYLMLIPEMSFAAVILNNGSHSGARGSVMQTIVKQYLQSSYYWPKEEVETNWIVKYQDYWKDREKRYLARQRIPKSLAPMNVNPQDIVGEYEDRWFGKLIISYKSDNKQLRIESERMITLKGNLIPFQDATYKIEWDNKNAANSAFIHFDRNVKREVTGARLAPFELTNNNRHEYRDMYFTRQVEEE